MIRLAVRPGMAPRAVLAALNTTGARTLLAPAGLRAYAAAGTPPSSQPEEAKEGVKDNVNDELMHFAFSPHQHPLQKVPNLQRPAPKQYLITAPAYSKEELARVTITHVEPDTFQKKLSYKAVSFVRMLYDKATGYDEKNMDEHKWIQRFIFLETVAGVPGMVGGMLRHLNSLGFMRRDYGWIHTLLEEAENERMHLLTFLTLKQPGLLFRGAVLGGQVVFFNLFFLSYLLSPKACHRFVGYLEEEAVRTYTKAIEDLEAGRLPQWTDLAAPEIARNYWRLSDDAKFLDVLKAVRADEANHRDVNHTFSSMRPYTPNPFGRNHH